MEQESSRQPFNCPNLSQINPIYIFTTYCFKMNFNIIVPHSSRSSSLSPSAFPTYVVCKHFCSLPSMAHITSKAIGQAKFYRGSLESSSFFHPCLPLSLCWKSSRIILWGRKGKRNLAEERFHHSGLHEYPTPNS